MEPGDDQAIEALGAAWAAAELAGDAHTLDALLTADFEAVGPSGYVIDREGWLARHRDGAISYRSFEWTHSAPRRHGDTALVIGLQTASAEVGEDLIGGRYRATLIAVRTGDGWLVAGLQLTELPDGV